MNIRKLQNLIDGKKITKASIVKKTGISRPALDSILDGNDFKVSNLEKIANALCVTVGYFFDDEIIQINETRQAGRDYVERGNIEYSNDVLSERVKHLEMLISEKNERISELKERIEELKR